MSDPDWEQATVDVPSVLELTGRLVSIPSRGGIDDYEPVLAVMDEWLAARGLPTSVAATGHRPFGMRLAVEPIAAAAVDVDALVWDDDAQIMLLRDGTDLSPAFKHTSTHTGTSTASQDRSGPDTDSDATGT